jgi:hypothetical protein
MRQDQEQRPTRDLGTHGVSRHRLIVQRTPCPCRSDRPDLKVRAVAVFSCQPGGDSNDHEIPARDTIRAFDVASDAIRARFQLQPLVEPQPSQT